jgi:hypothetical protein
MHPIQNIQPTPKPKTPTRRQPSKSPNTKHKSSISLLTQLHAASTNNELTDFQLAEARRISTESKVFSRTSLAERIRVRTKGSCESQKFVTDCREKYPINNGQTAQ